MNDIIKECRKANIVELRRARRLSMGLTKAIKEGNPNRIAHWQVLGLSFYNINYCDWVASQVDNHNKQAYKEFYEKEGHNVQDYLNRHKRV